MPAFNKICGALLRINLDATSIVDSERDFLCVIIYNVIIIMGICLKHFVNKRGLCARLVYDCTCRSLNLTVIKAQKNINVPYCS